MKFGVRKFDKKTSGKTDCNRREIIAISSVIVIERNEWFAGQKESR